MSSFFNNTIPSSAISSQSVVASFEVSSVIVPFPIASEIILDIGIKQIRLIITTAAIRNAIHASFLTSFFTGFFNFMHATVTIIASANAIPSAIRYGLQELRTLITSSMLIANISKSSLVFFIRFGSCNCILPHHTFFGKNLHNLHFFRINCFTCWKF